MTNTKFAKIFFLQNYELNVLSIIIIIIKLTLSPL